MSPFMRLGAPVGVLGDTLGVQQTHLLSWSLPAAESARHAPSHLIVAPSKSPDKNIPDICSHLRPAPDVSISADRV